MKTLSLLAAAVAITLGAFGDLNYFVVPPGTAGVPANPDYLSWATAGTNIHEAVYLAGKQHAGKEPFNTQHTLFVKSGFYLVTNQLEVGDCKTTIRSSKGPDAMWELDREGTILCGGYPATTNRIFYSEGNSVDRAVKFCGFTVTNGYSSNRGGGIRFLRSARSDTGIYDCTVVDCHALMGLGGGIDFSPDNCKSGIISNCFVHSCSASNKYEIGYQNGGVGGGGIVIGQNGAAEYDTSTRAKGLRVFDTIVSNNVVCGNAIRTTGLWVRQTGAWIENCTIVSNRGFAMNGGNMAAAAAVGGTTRSTYVNLHVEGNYCAYSGLSGPGIQAGIGSVVTNCVFKNNWGSGSVVTLDSSIASYKSQSEWHTNPVKFVSCVIDGNRGSAAPAISVGYQSIVRNNLITHCTGYSGQAASIMLNDGSVRFENNTLVGNSKGVVSAATGKGCMVNCALDNDWNVHQATKSASQVGIIFSNCWISARSPTTQPQYNCKTMSTAEALFIDAANGDWHLQRKSPLRDAAMKLDWMTGATDLDGSPRLMDMNGRATPGALPDIGCYECALRPRGILIIAH